MNKVVLVGRLTRDPEVRYSQGKNPMAVAKYMLAVNRRFKRENEPEADFINCVVFGKPAEFAEKYFRKGMRVSVVGRIQTGSYVNRDGIKVYTTEIYVEEQEFAESMAERGERNHTDLPGEQERGESGDGFMSVPDGFDKDLPFN